MKASKPKRQKSAGKELKHPPLIVLRPDATDEELQKACDILNEARRQRLRELGRPVTDKD